MKAALQRNFQFSDCVELLRALQERDASAVIVGGQAVNFWAVAFEDDEPELARLRPFTSADLDLHLPDAAAQQVLRSQAAKIEGERDPFGKAFTIVSETLFIEGELGRVLVVDRLKMVGGLRPNEVIKGTMTVEFAGVTIRVLNPIACLKSKLFNLRILEQRDRQDEKHVRILIPCVRAFIRRLLREARNTGNYRPAHNAIKQVLLVTSRRSSLRTAKARRLPMAAILPLAELERDEHPKLADFVTRQLPKWRQVLRESA